MKTLDYFLAEEIVREVKKGNDKEIIRAYNHLKRLSQDQIVMNYMNVFYEKYWRNKYDFCRVRRSEI